MRPDQLSKIHSILKRPSISTQLPIFQSNNKNDEQEKNMTNPFIFNFFPHDPPPFIHIFSDNFWNV